MRSWGSLGRWATGTPGTVRNEHYDTVAAELLWTLEKALGDEFTP